MVLHRFRSINIPLLQSEEPYRTTNPPFWKQLHVRSDSAFSYILQRQHENKVQSADFRSMNLRLRSRGACFQQVEITSTIGLRNVRCIQSAKSSFVTRRIGFPFCAALL